MMIGRPGAGILQMNGQPTAQNNREAGADGDLSGFRNWQNEEHVRELAELWDVDPMTIPHWSEPTHVMQILRYIEQGSIGFLWVSGTNPAVSLPELARARELLASESLFLVVNDGYPTETTDLADVVLPCALWGERPGTYTNVDRTVHLSDKAVDPPGEARSDLDIWVDYAAGWVSPGRVAGRSPPGTPTRTPSKRGRSVRGGARATTPASATTCSVNAAAGSGRSRRRRLTARSACTPMLCSTPATTTARPTATTSLLVVRSPRRPTPPLGPTAAHGSRSCRGRRRWRTLTARTPCG